MQPMAAVVGHDDLVGLLQIDHDLDDGCGDPGDAESVDFLGDDALAAHGLPDERPAQLEGARHAAPACGSIRACRR